MTSYWNSTGTWRMEYYKTLSKKCDDELTKVELMEKQLDMEELALTYEVLENKKVHSVLDIGCGVGRQIISFAKDFGNVLFWGADISDCQIKAMTDMVREQQLNNVFPIVMDASCINSLDMKFDLIAMYNNSLGCISCEKRSKVIQNVKELLSENGLFLFSSFDAFEMAERCYGEWGINPVRINHHDRTIDLGVYVSLWKSEEMITEEMAVLGFRLISKKKAGLGTIYMYDLVLPNET